MIYKTEYNSPLGILSMASDGENLIGVWLCGQKYFEAAIDEIPKKNDNLKIFNKTKNWLNSYFKGEKPQISELQLAPKGSDFRQKVWKILCQIQYGKTITYKEIADKISPTMSAQAVGGAVGHNPISIIIPCHRVLGANGNLTGYAGGIENKIWLLKHENVDIPLIYK